MTKHETHHCTGSTDCRHVISLDFIHSEGPDVDGEYFTIQVDCVECGAVGTARVSVGDLVWSEHHDRDPLQGDPDDQKRDVPDEMPF